MNAEIKNRYAELKEEGLRVIPESNHWLWLKMCAEKEQDQRGVGLMHLFYIVNLIKLLEEKEKRMSIESIAGIINNPELKVIYSGALEWVALLSTRGAELLCASNPNLTLEAASEWIDTTKESKKSQDQALN